ncbi:Ig-like domain-containing protein, partial [Enterobacter asburiae]|uniref:Ig-like domain-containing protein n=1 Tax=Enterobacter asburiae TaxID=61645 RepID=UPI00192AA49C
SNVADVFGVGKAFVVKYNSGGWQYAGDQGQFTGTTANMMAWTSFPSSITGTVNLANLVSVVGGGGNTLWIMSNGTLYGSGPNANGCLGSGNSNPIPTPRTISTSCIRAFGLNACVTYLNNVGVPRVCGSTYGINGSFTPITSFASVTFPGATGTIYAKEWMCNEDNTIAIASAGASDTDHYLYTRGITTNNATYTKVSGFGPFTTFRVLDGGQSRFFIADDALYALGDSQRNLGLGDTTTSVTVPTVIPVPTGADWDLSKLTFVAEMKGDNMSQGATLGHWMVYDGNLFYTGSPKGFFGSTTIVGKFTNVPENSFEGIRADSITTGSIVGTTKQLTWSIDPPGAEIYDLQFSSSHPEFATIDANGLMTFVAEGGFDITMTAKTGTSATTLTDSSGGYANTMGMSTDSLSAMTVGDTKQLVYTVTPAGVENLDGYSISFSSEDPTVATVSSTGLITAVADGGTRIHATAAVQTVTADDSSYLSVNAP